MKPSTFARHHSFSWVPLLLALGGLFLAGCGATAPVIQSLDAPEALETNETGTFEASINEDADEPLTYTWDFGDGSSGSGLLANHAYRSPGTYTVTFTASNEAGEVSQQTEVTVTRPPQPARITTINATPNPAEEGQTVQFSSNVRGDTPVTYNWDFGDGSTGSGTSASHTYSEPGSYTVTLNASNDVGEDSRTLSLTVEPSLPPICTSVSEFNAAFFGRNSSTLTDEAQSALQENLDILSQCPNLSVRVEGFAAPGERSVSSLSEDRARAVAQFYEDNGIVAGRISTQAQGEPSGVTTKRGGTRQYRRADSIPQQ
jgi:PKD repeat protein